MIYYYFDPIKKQYILPADFCKYKSLLTFYTPYTYKAKIIWTLWNKSIHIRNFCKVKPEIGKFYDELIKDFVRHPCVTAYNKGTPGIEQKMTAISVCTVDFSMSFVKYATTEIARRNLNNEGVVLQQISNLNFTPKLQLFKNSETYTVIKTNVLKGSKVTNIDLNDSILKILLQLTKLKIDSTIKFNENVKTCFAHGDFCPWNMIENNKEIYVFDWEMAGEYPLGYDLYTFIFQPTMLLDKTKEFSKIINENIGFILKYFDELNELNWKLYLNKFIKIKIDLEEKKDNSKLLLKYNQLDSYVKSL